MQTYTAEVTEKHSLTSVVRHVSLRLASAEGFSFRPGQFIQFILDPTPSRPSAGLRGAGPRTLRQFSIASVPSRLPQIELCIDVSPMGKGSRFIEELQPGDPVTFRGPFGVFVVPPAEARPLEFVATGAGIAPIRAMVFHMMTSGNPAERPVTLTFGNRMPSDVLYAEEWRGLVEKEPSFHFQPALSDPPQDWNGFRGRVTDALRRRTDLVGRAFYICGNPQMVDDVRKVLEAAGVPQEDIHFEKFF